MSQCLRTGECLGRSASSASARPAGPIDDGAAAHALTAAHEETARARPWGRRVRLLDSIAEADAAASGCVVVTGSHGGLSAGRYAHRAEAFLAVFNDAGVGLDRAGIAALAWLQARGVAACTVAHDSARIGEAASTWADGRLSHANDAAAALGARPGLRLRDWLLSAA